MTVLSAADSVLRAIGGTPVVKLRKVVTPAAADVLVKLESLNPTGSYKDRIALAMIEGAEARGLLRPGMRASNSPAAAPARPWPWSVRPKATGSSCCPRMRSRAKSC